jgi:hypothetical protein
VKLLNLNVCGLRSKVISDDFGEYLRQFGIIFLTETKLDDVDDITIAGYEVLRKNRHHCSTHPSGGVCRLIQKDFFKFCKVLDNDHKHVLWCRIEKEFLLLDKDLICGVVYIPSENSKYSDLELFDQMENDIVKWRNDYDCYFCIAGDLNAHMGTKPDFIYEVANVDNENRDTPDILPNRSSSDNSRINNYGNRLLELCASLGIYIVNGRCGKDTDIGRNTCADRSVDDYFLMSPELFDLVRDFEVEDFNPLFSDKHNALSLVCSILHPVVQDQTSRPKGKLIWRSEKKDEFVQNIDHVVLDELIDWSENKLGSKDLTKEEIDAVIVPRSLGGGLENTGRPSVIAARCPPLAGAIRIFPFRSITSERLRILGSYLVG